MRKSLAVLTVVFAVLPLAAQANLPSGLDKALEQWKSATAAADTGTLEELYSIDPPGRVLSADGKQQFPISDETNFWTQLRSSGAHEMTMNVGRLDEQQGLNIVTLQFSFRIQTPAGTRQRYVVEQLGWAKQAAGWRIVANTRTPMLKMRPPAKPDPHLYDPNADAKADIANAVKQAAATHKRVILMFGGNWCYDCHVLNGALHEPDVAPLAEHFIVVHVDVGEDGKKNADLAQKYRIPVEKGVPALAVLSDTGALLYSQEHGEFESARSMDPDDLVAFLNRWKAAAAK